MMIERKDGLIINISNIGGLKYLMNVPFGIGKAACDRMASDCAVELKNDNITMVSLWPGPVKTEYIIQKISLIILKVNLRYFALNYPKFSLSKYR